MNILKFTWEHFYVLKPLSSLRSRVSRFETEAENQKKRFVQRCRGSGTSLLSRYVSGVFWTYQSSGGVGLWNFEFFKSGEGGESVLGIEGKQNSVHLQHFFVFLAKHLNIVSSVSIGFVLPKNILSHFTRFSFSKRQHSWRIRHLLCALSLSSIKLWNNVN